MKIRIGRKRAKLVTVRLLELNGYKLSDCILKLNKGTRKSKEDELKETKHTRQTVLGNHSYFGSIYTCLEEDMLKGRKGANVCCTNIGGFQAADLEDRFVHRSMYVLVLMKARQTYKQASEQTGLEIRTHTHTHTQIPPFCL